MSPLSDENNLRADGVIAARARAMYTAYIVNSGLSPVGRTKLCAMLLGAAALDVMVNIKIGGGTINEELMGKLEKAVWEVFVTGFRSGVKFPVSSDPDDPLRQLAKEESE